MWERGIGKGEGVDEGLGRRGKGGERVSVREKEECVGGKKAKERGRVEGEGKERVEGEGEEDGRCERR